MVREYSLPQIPIWAQVSDAPLSEEKADPIALNDILGSVFIYLGGMSVSSVLFVMEVIGKALMRSVGSPHKEGAFWNYILRATNRLSHANG